MRRAVFIVDDRPTSGLGHVTRSNALAQELRGRGWECVFTKMDDLPPSDAVIVDLRPDYPLPKLEIQGGRRLMVCVTDNPIQTPGWGLIVNGGAGATAEMYAGTFGTLVLAGPKYALIRPEFRKLREEMIRTGAQGLPGAKELDLRTIQYVPPEQLAWTIFAVASRGGEIITYGGMRLLEAACIAGACKVPVKITVEPQNKGEALNAEGVHDGAVIDGKGCERVADAIGRLARARDELKSSTWRIIFEVKAAAEGTVAALSGRMNYTDEQLDFLVQDTARALDLSKADSLLDIGCAAGFVGERLAPLVGEYAAVDYAAGSLGAYAQRCPTLNIGLGSATALPFPDDHFDKTNLGSVLLCLTPDEQMEALREMRRVTRIRGFASGNPDQPRLDQVNWFTREELIGMALKAGWREAKTVNPHPEIPDAAELFDVVMEA